MRSTLVATAYLPLRAHVTEALEEGHCRGCVCLITTSSPGITRNLPRTRWLQRSWQIVDPEHFSRLVAGREPLVADSVLLTFDDGYASSRVIAETVLGPLKVHALFFVVTGFVALQGSDDRQAFVARHFFPGMDPALAPVAARNMGWDDLAYLLDQGHTIGAHTATHVRLTDVAGSELDTEIVGSGDLSSED